jgi:O-antigen/teichoic acid export membrane protein
LVRLLSKQDCTTYNQILLVPSIAIPIFSFGIPFAFLKLLPHKDTAQRRTFMVGMAILFAAAFCLAIGHLPLRFTGARCCLQHLICGVR